jgi:hypothetical protein
VGIAALVVFLWVESRAADPIIPLALLRSRSVGLPTAAMVLMAAGMFGALLFVPLFLQGVGGRTAAMSGSTLTPLMLGFVAASVIAGHAIARVGHYRWIGVGGMLVAALGLALMSRMTPETSDIEVIRNLAVAGLGLGTALSSFAVANQTAVPLQLVGTSTALGTFARAIGGTFGSAGFGAVLADRMQSAAGLSQPAALASGLQATFLVAMAVLLAGAGLAVLVHEVPLRQAAPRTSSVSEVAA